MTSMSGISTTIAIAESTMSTERLRMCLPPSNVGVSTWIRGRPSTGRKWIRGPATSVSRDESTSSAAVPSRSQPSCRTNSPPSSGWPATMTASAFTAAAAVATPSRRATTGIRRSPTVSSPPGASSTAAPTTRYAAPEFAAICATTYSTSSRRPTTIARVR